MKYIKICPQCGSINTKLPNAGLDLHVTIRDKCMDCGFIGNFPEIETEKIESFQKKVKNGRKNTDERK